MSSCRSRARRGKVSTNQPTNQPTDQPIANACVWTQASSSTSRTICGAAQLSADLCCSSLRRGPYYSHFGSPQYVCSCGFEHTKRRTSYAASYWCCWFWCIRERAPAAARELQRKSTGKTILAVVVIGLSIDGVMESVLRAYA